MEVVTEGRREILGLIRMAVLAPSSHNTQPWLFRVSGSAIDLLADRTRALPVNDPEDRELTISCGCALMNLRAAAVNHGFRAQVQVLPDATDPDWLARMSLYKAPEGPAEEAALAELIDRRRTDRKDFATQAVDPAAIAQLVAAATAEGAWLRPLLTEDARRQAATLVAEGDAAQWGNPRWRRELAAWMHTRRRGDGLTVPALALPLARLVIRSFDLSGRVGAKDRKMAESSPLLAVLGTTRDGTRDWLQVGQALQRVLLVACRHGLQASYLNQPIQVATLRPGLQNLVGGGSPQMLLRFGHPREEPPAAPRRPLEAVIEWAS
jgi:nitroreductase